jgi:AbrB family looped-hinge helix DNA binding protein
MSEYSVTSKGQVTIPEVVRRQLGLRAGSKVHFRVVGSHAEITRADNDVSPRSSAAGMLNHRAPACPPDFDVASLVDAKPDQHKA